MITCVSFFINLVRGSSLSWYFKDQLLLFNNFLYPVLKNIAAWPNLRVIKADFKSQSSNITFYIIPFIWRSQRTQTILTTNQELLVLKGGGLHDYKREHKGGFWGDGFILYPDCTGDYTNLYVKIYRTIQQNKVNFTICSFKK